MELPKAVLDALEKLDASDKAVIENYIKELKGIPVEEDNVEEEEVSDGVEIIDEDEDDTTMSDGATMKKDSASDFPPLYESGDDGEKAGELKMQASDAKCSGDYAKAMEIYTEAICASQPSAMTYSARAECLLKLERPCAAIRDCDEALKINADSAKALRIRGRSRRAIGDWELARKDLSASQAIDFDDTAMIDLKFVTEKVSEIDKQRVQERLAAEEKKKKRAAEIKRAQEEARKEAEEEARQQESMPGTGGMPGGMPGMGGMPGGMPGMGGMPGGMGGMPGMPAGMGELFNDPEIASSLKNPKVMAALSSVMSGGMPDMGKISQLMADPEVGPVLQKIMGKFMGGGMGGMPGGMGGMPGGMGGMGGGSPSNDTDFDDMPDLD